jgi:hypothetical protein
VSAYCGDATCALRVEMWRHDPTDHALRQPCPQCVDALADDLLREQEDTARTLRSVDCHIVGPL